MTTPMNPSVKQAVEEVKAALAPHAVNAVEDDEGGAFVQVQDLSFGDRYEPASGWMAFRIMYNYPHADIYPHYVTADLKRRDGKELGEGFSRQEMALGRWAFHPQPLGIYPTIWSTNHHTEVDFGSKGGTPCESCGAV
jgi:hypothetical protein